MKVPSVAVGLSFVAAGFGAGFGCGGSGFKTVPASTSRQQNVMVIDEGFDLSISELQGRIAAAYTESCADASSGGDGGSLTGDAGAVDGGPQFDMLKQALLASLAVPDDSCHITAGIGPKTNPLASVQKYRDRWNAMIRANETATEAGFTADELNQLETSVDDVLMAFDDHGTSTAGTIVHDNPGARLVLVERQLGDEAALQSSFTCFLQADIDQIVDLYEDPQVFTAAVDQPAQLDGELATAMATYDVGVVNESFGAEARQALEMLQTSSNCAPIDLAKYFALINKITLAHNATLTGSKVLTVEAAGNDGAEIDSGADSLSCDIGDPLNLLVGAYDPPSMTRNTFSNFGTCVDLYAPGQAVVAPYAGDWLLPIDGTSFSSPLVARQISLSTGSFDPVAARTALIAQADANHVLPAGLFPADFFYTPAETPVDAIWPTLLASANRAAKPRPPNELDLHRLLGPIARLRALRGR